MQDTLKRIKEFILAAEKGDFSQTLPETSEGMLGDLERGINRLVRELHSVREDKIRREVMEKELRISRAIQTALLPAEVPEIPGMEIGAIYRPAQEIGGDYYDFIDIDQDHLGIAIADVSGKSISGAMFMTITRNTLRAQAMLTLSPREALQRTERLLVPSMTPGFFVSIFYAVLEKESKKLLCANAGHLPLLHFQFGTRECAWVRPRGIAIGLLRDRREGAATEECEIKLESGDLAFFYTDGVTEAEGEDRKQFGRDRIAELAKEIGREGAKRFLSGLEERLVAFSAGHPQMDDITAVVLGRSGTTLH